VIPETAALAMVKRYGANAMLEAAARADQLLPGRNRSSGPRVSLVSGTPH
jgi:hypothetical protein